MKVAIVGSGVAGMAAGYLLSREHEVTVYERDSRIGGHVNTFSTKIGDSQAIFDTGFIVYNSPNYPYLVRLFDELKVETKPSTMSFSLLDGKSGLEWKGTSLNSVFAQRRNALNPKFLRMLIETRKFNNAARELLEVTSRKLLEANQGLLQSLQPDDKHPRSHQGRSHQDRSHQGRSDQDRPHQDRPHQDRRQTLGEFIEEIGLSNQFVEWYLIPLGSAIWSSDPSKFLEFPAYSFCQFFNNHGLLSTRVVTPWRTVVGGASTYISKIETLLAERGCKVLRECVVTKVRRVDNHVEIHLDDHVEEAEYIMRDESIKRDENIKRDESIKRDENIDEAANIRGHRAKSRVEQYDHVVLAVHSDQALQLLSDPSEAESEILGSISYQPSEAIVHTDSSVMPRSRRAWASWNYYTPTQSVDGPCVTYWMNELQSFESDDPVFVTLNRRNDIDPKTIHASFNYAHPILNTQAVIAQSRHAEIDGHRNTSYAGAYWGFGFHEDGLRSAVTIAKRLGVEW